VPQDVEKYVRALAPEGICAEAGPDFSAASSSRAG